MRIKAESKGFRILAVFLSIVLFCAGIILTLGIFLPVTGSVSTENPLFDMGQRLFSVYGFSAFLIPLLLLYGAVLLLLPGWSRESKMVLLGVPLYFATVIIGERLIYVFSPSVSIPIIRHFAVVSIVICMLLLVCFEIFLMLTLSEKTRGRHLFAGSNTTKDIVSETYDEGEEPEIEPSGAETDTLDTAAADTVRESSSDTAEASANVQETSVAEAEVPEPEAAPEQDAEEPAAASPDAGDTVRTDASGEENLSFLEQIEADTQVTPPASESVGATKSEESGEAQAKIHAASVSETGDLPLSTPIADVAATYADEANETPESQEPQAAAIPEFDPSDPDNLFASLEEITAPIERIKQTDYTRPQADTVPAASDEAAGLQETAPDTPTGSAAESPEMPETPIEQTAATPDIPTGASGAAAQQAADTIAAAELPVGAEMRAHPDSREAEDEAAVGEDWEPAMPLVFTNGVPLPNERSDLLDTMVIIDSEPEAAFELVRQEMLEPPQPDPTDFAAADTGEPEEKAVFGDETDEVFEDEDTIEPEEPRYTDDDIAGRLGDEPEAESPDTEQAFLERIEQTAVIVPAKPVPQPPRKKYAIPFDLLTNYPDGEYWIVDDATRRSALMLKSTFNEFKIDVSITGIRKGPVVTMFEMLPSPGIKLSKITNLQDNIALRLAASSVRIVAPIPGKHAVGIEVPNKKRSIVSFRELIETDLPEAAKMAIPVALGKDVTGNPQLLDLVQTPHLLIAGATGSGKSVCVNSIILSILYNRRPDEVKLILVDPKIVELKLYNDIAHLLTPVITEPKRAFQALQYALCEMERRYALLDNMGVRDIKTFNAKIKAERIATEALPYIVIIIDEFADLMATSGKELEATVARLCAMSRAVGIHLVLATQRPSIDVITGLIKANIPSRIAFMVASKTDSRIILDEMGAEKLLGKGDMLYVSAAQPFPTRIQGAFVSEQEVERVVACVKEYCEPEYIDDEIFVDDDDETYDNAVFSDDNDPLYDQALEIVTFAGKASASYVQRKLKIGYNRAARLIEEMEARGIVGPANGSKPREVIRHV